MPGGTRLRAPSAPTYEMHRLAKTLAPLAVLTFPKHHIRWKIILPYVFLSAILAIVATYLVTRLVTSSLTERFDNQLVEAGRVTADDVVRKEREHLETVRAVAFTQGVAESIEGKNGERLESLIEPVAANAAVERVEVLDAQGQRRATEQPPCGSAAPSGGATTICSMAD